MIPIILSIVFFVSFTMVLLRFISRSEIASLSGIDMSADDLPPFMRRVQTDDSYTFLITVRKPAPDGYYSTPESRTLANPNNLSQN
jgi:hypothetical protein